ncbi:MAG: hypothetical protein IJU69_04720 [Bacteroidales bacterium]|nr:hypothetical protein [Bacteroidales bacterium]
MKKYLVFATAVLLFAVFACIPEDKDGVAIVTGEADGIAPYSARLNGHVKLSFEYGDAEVGIMYDETQSFETYKKVKATISGADSDFSVVVNGLSPKTTDYFLAYVKKGVAYKYGAVKSFTTKESECPAGTIDLGIVITRSDGTNYKLYWAESNLCESGLCANPWDYGDYYAWGETEPKEDYSWTNLKYCTDDVGKHFNKYVPSYDPSYWSGSGLPDNLYTLSEEDDAAHAKLGGKWRMPTEIECSALRAACTSTMVDNYKGDGVSGRLYTAPNGNSIFLPAGGYRDGTYVYKKGLFCYYLSSRINGSIPSSASGIEYNVYRNQGCLIRPVTE